MGKVRGRKRERFALSSEDLLDLRMKKLFKRLYDTGAFVEVSPEGYKISIKPWVEASTDHELRACGSVWIRVLHVLSREKNFFKINLLVFASFSSTLENLMVVTEAPVPFEKLTDDPFLVKDVPLPIRVYDNDTFRLPMDESLEYVRHHLETMGYLKTYGIAVPCNRILEIIIEMV